MKKQSQPSAVRTSGRKHGRATPIAIIGMSGCFPNSPNLDALWNNLRDGIDCVGVLPLRERWDVDATEVDIAHAGVVDGIEMFQSAFFDISPREASWMDPQQRLLMVHVWKAIEDAGYAPRALSGKNVAVLVGTGNSGYAALCAETGRSPDAYSACGSVPSIGPNRISNLFNLKGPSEPIETACSSSLVALHRGVKLLQDRHCDAAIVGGVNTIVSLDLHTGLARAGMLSPDGRCRPFSADANGYVRGEGAGILLLKRLSDAERDGDAIHGVILGSAENHCGRTASLTAPSSLAQAAVIREAIQSAGVDPATITYVEAHGTGTPLGDPIEVKGLTNAFLGLGTSGQQWKRASCALGSIKGNIGHLELSAGIAGVIKVLLQMKHRTLARSMYSDSPNPHIDFSQGPFCLVTQTQPWKAQVDPEGKALPLRAGVSSFGFGGVNAHVVLEEYVSQGERNQDNEPSAQFIVLSADSERALKARAALLADWVDECTPTPGTLEQVAYTLQVGRKPMEFRMGFKADSLPELSEVLREYLRCGNVSSNDTFLHGRVSRQGELPASQTALADALKRWISGAEVDWPLLRIGQLPRRVSLPTYSFEGERFWPVARTTEPGTAARGASGRNGTVGALVVTVEPRQVRNSVIAKDALRGQVTQVLLDMAKSRGINEHIDPDAEFGALGFDSLDMADLSLEIRGTFGFDVDTTAFFQYPTLSKLGHFIADTFSEVLVEHFSGTRSPQSMAEEGTSAAVSEGEVPEGDPMPCDSAGSECSANPVAIVGMSGAFPMSPNLDHLWRNLLEGRDCIGRLPLVRRWGVPEDSVAVAHAGVLDETELFDPLFFGISPREAEAMDPQQRLLMTHAWAAIEDSGHAPHSLSNERVALIVGTGYSGYGTLLERAGTKVEGYSAAGMAAAMGPNRTSYFLNLRGPSEPVDTACSSSLVALHRAVQLIRSGECTSAVAGGVNTLISLEVQNSLAKAGMLSQEGRCKTFSSRADGYVRSEGVGMLYLKNLAAAERDGDSIYAVIKGSAVNHGGRTASLTAPSPLAQSEVVTEAIRNAAVDPATITYVEAHGTGTPLGDPVEISGLTQAFRETAVRELPERSCGIGSIKSNVGHLEMCAGIAGVIKVLLQMKHRTLVKSLHADELNGRIDFASSPFFVVREAVDWNRLKDPAGLELPLRAGVSSFGFGGVNAHVVLEEYLQSATREQDGVSCGHGGMYPHAIVLSARSPEALREHARQILAWARSQPHLEPGKLERLAYTLQVGRESMEHRLGFVAASKSDLIAGLVFHIEGSGDGAVRLFQGVAMKGRSAGTLEKPDAELRWHPEKLHFREGSEMLLRRWVAGLPVDWTCLYGGRCPERLSLPTYPFSRDRYWPSFPETRAVCEVETCSPEGLQMENVSVMNEVRFRMQFDPCDAFLRDHVLAGRCVVPAAIAVERVCQAVANAMSVASASDREVRLTDLMFSQPLWVPDTGLRVLIVLHREADGDVSWWIRNEDLTDTSQVYVRGRAQVRRREAARIEVQRYRQECCVEVPVGVDLYAALAERGLDLGATFQTLAGAWRQREEAPTRRALAELTTGSGTVSAPTGENWDAEALDGALQLVAALDLADGQTPGLPFAVEAVAFHAPLPRRLIVTLDERVTATTSAPPRYDIIISDEEGAVCVTVSGFVTRVLHDPHEGAHSTVERGEGTGGFVETMLLRQALVPVRIDDIGHGRDAEHTVILCGIETDGPVAEEHFLRVPFRGDTSADAFLDCTASLFSLVTEFARPGSRRRIIQVVVPQDGPGVLLGRLDGALKSISDEYRSLRFQLILVSRSLAQDKLLEILRFGRTTAHRTLVYSGTVGDELTERVWELAPEQPIASSIWKDGGVYLITGGLGAIGRAVAADIIGGTSGATVVLVSRNVSDASTVEASLQGESTHARVVIKSVDVAEQRACTLLVAAILSEFGRLDGILHCAGIVADAGFLGRPEDGLCNALRPKARGVENLDLASASVDLDFFVCFSSLASSHGNPGQVDYAAANAFMDAFMDHRAQEVRKGNRRGRSLSINWPLWREGGMRGSAESARRHQMRFGMVPISNESALLALHRAVAWSTESAVAIIEGVRTLLPLEVLDSARKFGTLESGDATLLESSADDEPSVVSYLLEAVSRATQVPAEAIAPDQPFSDYGVDSILALDLAAELEARFGPLDRTVLFEYPTLRMLTQYLNSRVEQAIPSGAVASGPLVATNGMAAGAPVVERLRAKVADAVGMPVESISDTVPFNDYGVDSILVLDLTTRLEQEFGPLEKTVFFEYPTIKELAMYLGRQQARPIARSPVVTPPRRDVLGTRYSDIAVVGMSGRYPKSPDLESFWKNLQQGMDCVEEIPNERWDWRGRSPRNRWGGFIEGVDRFDPLFFNISPRDAERIDPQERLFLQCAYAALEDAGYTPDEFGGAETEREVGVFVGVMYEEYQLYAAEAQARGIDVAVSGSAASVANRVSYSFNFRGPSIALDTMCSSSLTAIHLACQSIRNGDCRSAIAGGVNVSIHPNKYLLLSQARFESTEGRCASFGRGGNGYVPAEGVGAVVLKELAAALQDGDHVYGVIRGSAINSGGRSQGYTAPNPDAQAAVIAAALRRADVDPRDISYVEAHGTGTHLGDPIEIAGLARAFAQSSARAESCAIGSVKSNIGHAEAAAGIAGFTKVLLQMKYRMLVPSIHSDELNPLIDFDRTPFRVQRCAESWEPVSGLGTAKSLRRAAVSSFGAGGANAHIVLEEYPEPIAANAGERSVVDVGSLFVLSARTEVQLRQSATRLREWLKIRSGEGVDLMDVAYTLQVGRVAREFRLGVVASRLPELLDGLSAYLEVDLVDRPAGVFVGTAHPGGGSRGVEDQAFDEMVRTNRVGDLLAAWVEGVDMPWRQWHSAARRRMSLPTYPFAKERYWIETGSEPVLHRTSVPSLTVDAARPASAEAFDRIRELLASLLQVPIDALDGTRSLDAYGIDSILLMEFSDELSNQFGIDLGSAELYLQPTIDQLVTHILSRVGDASTEAPQTGGTGEHPAPKEGNRSCLGEFVGLRLLNTLHTSVAVFYPTHAAPRAVRMGAFTLSVAVDAPPEPRVKGLIVICHGREGSQLMHHDLAEWLASAGYIVAALEHPTDSWKDTSLADSPDFFSTRPREALQAIDAMLEHPHWQSLLCDLPIGIVAHSAGAIDALSLMGARVTVASASESASICRHIPGVINLPVEQSLPPASERLLTPDLKDSRIQGCVLLAPFTEPFDSSSLASVETPIRIYLAEKDETLDNGTNGYRAQKTLPRCEVVTLPALNHYSFIAPNGRIDPSGAGRRKAPAPWGSGVVAFFNEHLRARGSAV